MPGPPLILAAGTHSAGFDLLLIGHVACALVGFGALAASGVQAARLARCAPSAVTTGLRRYFAPGTNWAGRILYGVPVFGFALLADSSGTFTAGEGWVVIGLVLWGFAAVAAEAVLWPAERRIQAALADAAGTASLRRDCLVVARVGSGLTVVFAAATVVMVARPG